MSIGKIEKVPLREAFPHEALNFTQWLETNIDALSQPIGLELTVIEREKAVGSFNVDLFCQDGTGKYVIVENQLERSDHDHLGKLLTYLVNLEAKTAIWVTPEVRVEHERVIDWLNESTSADFAFYLVQVDAIRIGDSPFAPLFTVLAAPDEQLREIGETKKELADQQILRREFWTQLLERSKGKTKLFSGRSPSMYNWWSGASGRAGIQFVYYALKNGAGVELYIDVKDQEKNKAIFDELLQQKTAIEAELGEPLHWQRLDKKRACRIAWTLYDSVRLSEPDTWPALQDKMIDAMIRLDKVLRARIAALNIS